VPAERVARPQDTTRQQEYATRWLSLDPETKNKVKQAALMTLGSANRASGGLAAQVIAAIAVVELPNLQWGELIETLIGFVNNSEHTNLRIATLQAIGYICEQVVGAVSMIIRAIDS
jgi:importin subunit beta-1